MQNKIKKLLESKQKIINENSNKIRIIKEIEKIAKPVFDIKEQQRFLKIPEDTITENSLTIELENINHITENQLNELKKLLGYEHYKISFYKNFSIKLYSYSTGVDPV